jgi:peptidyl-prolyl cis-trans isomerase C
MRRSTTISAIALATALVASLLAAPAGAQTKPAAAPADPVLATVGGLPIHMSDVQASATNLPQQLQQLPPDQLFPLLVNQQIDRKALLIAAKKTKLVHDPIVAAAMQRAADEQLENAYIQEQVTPQVTDADVQEVYKKQYAGNPAQQQVDARQILVKTQAEAQAIIDQLNKGADFATLATKDSIDPGAKDGGELGWFSQNGMIPAFSAAAFALKPNTYTKTPVQSQFGWHVILCEGKRDVPFDTVKDTIRQDLANTAIKATLAAARAKVKIVVNNPDGSPASAQPATPPAAPPAASPATPPAQ